MALLKRWNIYLKKNLKFNIKLRIEICNKNETHKKYGFFYSDKKSCKKL